MSKSVTMPSKIETRLRPKDHLKYDWECKKWLSDFQIEDVWRFPVELEARHSLAEFNAVFAEAMRALETQGIAGKLFQFRKFLGRIFGWDGSGEPSEIMAPWSLRARYAKANGLQAVDLLPPGDAPFVPVYALEAEQFSEISNATVHAGLHLGKVPLDAGNFTVQLTVYNQPRGFFGRVYMGLITPFRLWVVYPTMLRLVGKAWAKHLKK